MILRAWLWMATALCAIMFIPSAMMAFSAVGFWFSDAGAGAAAFVAFLFMALPVFCVLAPYSAWRIHRKRPRDLNASFIIGTPIAYAVFLFIFLL